MQVNEIAPVMDYLDSDRLVKYLVDITGIPAQVIRSDAQVAEIREAQAEQQAAQAQQQQQMMAAEQMQKAAPMVKAVGGLPGGLPQ